MGEAEKRGSSTLMVASTPRARLGRVPRAVRYRHAGPHDGRCRHGRPGGDAGRALREVDGPRRRLGGVADAWLEPHEGADEPHAGVARRRGAAVPRPVCGAPRGARDSRGRAWRHTCIPVTADLGAGRPGRRRSCRSARSPPAPARWPRRPGRPAPCPAGSRPPEGSIGGRAGWRTPTSRG